LREDEPAVSGAAQELDEGAFAAAVEGGEVDEGEETLECVEIALHVVGPGERRGAGDILPAPGEGFLVGVFGEERFEGVEVEGVAQAVCLKCAGVEICEV
jgi:hypothetical protein